MDKITDLKAKRSKLLEELVRISQEIEAESNNTKRWKPKKGEKYYYLECNNESIYCEWNDTQLDQYRYNTGNCFKTYNEAHEYGQSLLTIQQLRDLALELNKGVKINWGDIEQEKFYIYFNTYDRELNITHSYFQKSLGQIYCLDPDFLTKAIEQIGKNKLMLLLESELN